MINLNDFDYFWFSFLLILNCVPVILVFNVILEIASSFLLDPKGRV